MRGELQPEDPQRVGPYQLIRLLGGGGMGQVYLGRSPGGRLVAVKMMRPELAYDPQFRARFQREVAAARKVDSLYTAAIVDVDVDGPVPWLATDYVAGPSLAEAINRYGPLPVASVRALAAGLAAGLSAIHAAGIVHRDLKPSNILLADDGPRVVDFGLSRAAETGALTQTGMVIGSPGYMAPEQAVGQHVGPPCDLFCLGAILTFATTNRSPFGDGAAHAVLYRLVHDPPDLDGVPAEILDLVRRCLAKDPGERPTAAALLAELGGIDLAKDWPPSKDIGKVTAAMSSALATSVSSQTSVAQSPHLPSAAPKPPTPNMLRLHYALRSKACIPGAGNRDSAYAGPRVLAVADGMGYPAGKVASAVAIAAMAQLDSKHSSDDLLHVLGLAITNASARLQEMIAANPAISGMRTTLTALLWQDGNAAVCHIGDSRGYLLRNRELYQITHDHTLVQSLIDEERIPADTASVHPQRSVLLRVLDGRSNAEPDLSVHESQADDRYLLCSDGLSDVVSDHTLRETLGSIADPEAATRQLIELALRSGSRDNITCIVADVADMTTKRALPTITPALAGAIDQNPDLWATVTPTRAIRTGPLSTPHENSHNTRQSEIRQWWK